MQKFFDVEIDVANMTTEELEDARMKARELLSNIEYQLLLRKISEHKFKSTLSSDTAKL